MKKIPVLLMGIVLAGSITACGSTSTVEKEERSEAIEEAVTTSQGDETAALSPDVESQVSDYAVGKEGQDTDPLPEDTVHPASETDISDQTDQADQAAQTLEESARTGEGADSLALLRQSMNEQEVSFGTAYLGYVGGLFEEGFAKAFPTWLEENKETLLEEYPFIREIDQEHMIGRAGCLYCIVPEDENATVSINRVTWNEKTQRSEVTEVLYRAESGEPVLLFANTDEIYNDADTQVFVTDSEGNTVEWYPSLDEAGNVWPCIRDDGTYASWDFTEYQYQTDSGLEAWQRDGWLGPTDLGLAGEESAGQTWTVTGAAWESGRRASFSLCFYPGDEDGGRVDLDWHYAGETEEQEQWAGFWMLQTQMDQPSYVNISLSLVGGKSYADTDGPMYISETYPVLVDLSGMHLVIGRGASGICLPFMTQADLATVLVLK